jgi:putative ABC transport system permease protein
MLIILSIALGVATLVATQSLTQSLKKGVEEGVNPLSGLADLLIDNGQTGVRAELATELRKARIAGVEGVTPFVLWRMSLADLDNKIVWLMGVEWPKSKDPTKLPGDDNLLGVTIHQTYHPKAWTEQLALLLAPPALVSDNLARELDNKDPKSRRFRLRNAGRTPEVTRMGTVTFAESSLPLQDSAVVVMDLMSASAICFPERPGYVHQIGITIAKNANLEQVRADLKRWVGDRGDVKTIEGSKQLVSDVTAGLEIGFAIGGAVALVVGLFLVYNALSVSVAERRHDIGILRSVGATRWQIAGLFVSESLCMGLTGCALGLPLGWLLGWLAIKPMANTVSDLLVPIDRAQVLLSPSTMALAVISGTLVAVLAALVPALQAAGEEPADAVRRVPQRRAVLLAILQIAATVLLLLGGFALARFRHELPARAGMFAGIVCLVLGGLISTPLLASQVGRVIQPFFRYFLGLEGRLAADNLVRAPGRTGLVIAALAATGGLLVVTAGFLKSTRVAIYDWIEEKVAADLFVSSGTPVTSGGAALTMQDGFRQQLQALEGVDVIVSARGMRVDYKSPKDGLTRIVWLLAFDTVAFEKAAATRPLNANHANLQGLRQKGKVVLSENFAALYDIKKGDVITIPGRDKELKLEVVGLATDYTWNRGTIFMDLGRFREEFADQQIDIFNLFLTTGTRPEKVQAEILDRYQSEYALFVITRPEVHNDVRNTLNRVYSLAYAQQTVVGMVALLGVVSALFISVLQRQRELGLLRAVGASRSQILRSVLAEAVLMGAIGALIGFGIGLLLEWYVLDILLLDESGFEFRLRVPWIEAGFVTLASIALATLAGLWPAYHATRLRIPEAIAYE